MNVLKKDLFARPGARSKQGRGDLSTVTLNSAAFSKNLLPFLPQTENNNSTTSGGSRPTGLSSPSQSFNVHPDQSSKAFHLGSHRLQSERRETVERRHSNAETHEVEEIMSQHQQRIEGKIVKKASMKNPDSAQSIPSTIGSANRNILQVLSDTSPEYQFLKPLDDLTYRAPTNQDKEDTVGDTTERSAIPVHSGASQISSIRNKTTSSEKKTPKNQSIALKTSSSSAGTRTDAELSCCVVAVTEGRGHASGEVGIAAMDPRRPHLILCQISDSQRFTRTLTKLNVFNFTEAIVPNTFVEGPTPRKLYMDILDRFPSVTVNHVQRRHFSEATGLQMIQQYCSQQSESVMVVLKDKFYALAAAAALLKYIEFTQSVLFAPYSLKVEFQGTEGTTIIDLDTANRLELIMGLVSRDERQSLLGVLKHCRTRGGVRLLRANLLQPFSDSIRINSRLDCVEELIENPILFNALEAVISQMKSAESLLCLCMHPPQQSGLKAAQYQLKYVLLLKTTLELVPALLTALETATSDYFQIVRENLTDRRLSDVLKRIHQTIVEGTPGFRPGTFNQLHACFMICAGINGLLDIAKKTYCELAQEISDLVDGLKEKLQLPMRLGFSQGKGYHIVLSPLDQVPVNNLPSELILVQKSRSSLICYTSELVALDQRCQQALHEIELMSNVLLFELLNDIRDKIACLFPLCECVAELDVCIALAHIGTNDGYARPTFGGELNLKAARHPILDVTSKERIVANDVFADTDNNFAILTGPNQSGKSIYIRQIALLQVMAQVGSFVPAATAQFRIADRIFSRIGFDDNIESNASTLMVELQDMKFIMDNLTKNSLIIVDELCRGTSVDEGTCLAFVLCEQLIDTNAFTFFTTHFLFLTKLKEMYYNVRNFHFETMLSGDGKPTLRYTHKMLKGITPAEQYGIQLAQLMGFSDSILEAAKICASYLLRERKPQPTVFGISARYEISQKMRSNLPQSDDVTWEQMVPVIRHYKEQYDALPPEDPALQNLLSEKPVIDAEDAPSSSSSNSSNMTSGAPHSLLETAVRQLSPSEVEDSPVTLHSMNEGGFNAETNSETSLHETSLISSIIHQLSAERGLPDTGISAQWVDEPQETQEEVETGQKSQENYGTTPAEQVLSAKKSSNAFESSEKVVSESFREQGPQETHECPNAVDERESQTNSSDLSPVRAAETVVTLSDLMASGKVSEGVEVVPGTSEGCEQKPQEECTKVMAELVSQTNPSDPSLDRAADLNLSLRESAKITEKVLPWNSEGCDQEQGKTQENSPAEVLDRVSAHMESDSVSELENSARTQEAAMLLLNLHTSAAPTPTKRKWTPPFKHDCKNEKGITKKLKPTKEKPRIDEFVRNLGSTLPDIVDKSAYYQWKYAKDKKGLSTVATACRYSPSTAVKRGSSLQGELSQVRAGPSSAKDPPAAKKEVKSSKS